MIERCFIILVQFPIRVYQYTLSPILSAVFGMRCRFDPSCSHYMAGAIEEWGPLKGVYLGLKRISRCHPWGGFGPDPVPINPKRKVHAKETEEK